MNNKIYLCSFASEDLNKSVDRFEFQAKKMNVYSGIKVFRPKDFNPQLLNRVNDIINQKGKYLYGYAIWKPAIVKSYLMELEDDAILQYSDIGCHLNHKGIERLNDYIELVKKNKMLAFEYGEPPETFKKFNYNFQSTKEYKFTKGDVFSYFNLNENSKIYNSPLIWAGSFFVSKNEYCFKIIKEWEEACKFLHLLDDSRSKTPNHKEHIGMRGDQSLFSILCKINNVKKLSASECEWAEGKDETGRKWDHLENYPILAKRDLKYGYLKRFLNRQKKTFRRIKNKIFGN
tara:strand:+ start:5120 stop:5986 length:867 start_codon:yes stop_codon:yes gene_type:complete